MSELAAEIAGQPEAIGRLVGAVAPELPGLRRRLGDDVDHVVIAARGSSDNAARYAQYLFAIQHRLPVALATPSVQSLYGITPRLDRALVVAVSQSGRSPDVVGVLRAARDQGRPAIAVTNAPDSPLADAATHVVDLRAGEERSVAATKTYTTSLVALALLSTALATPPTAAQRLRELEELPSVAAAVLAGSDVGATVELLGPVGHLPVTGRGLSYGTAFEAALKLRELTGTIAEAFSPPDLLHGPIAALGEGATALLVAPTEPSLADQRRLLDPLRRRGARIVAVTADPGLLEAADLGVALPAEPAAWLTPVTTIIPAQLLAADLAVSRGRDPDRPGGLSKVTLTR